MDIGIDISVGRIGSTGIGSGNREMVLLPPPEKIIKTVAGALSFLFCGISFI